LPQLNWSGMLSDRVNGRQEFFQFLLHCFDFSVTQQAQSVLEVSNSHLQPEAETVKLLVDSTLNDKSVSIEMTKSFMFLC